MTTSLRFAAASLCFALAACSGGSEDTATSQGIQGSVAKGLVSGATVNVFAIDELGFKTGSSLCSTTTSAQGAFTLLPSSCVLPAGALHIAESLGGSYEDESDTANPAGSRRRITLGASQSLAAILMPGSSSLALTPYTTALLRKARAQDAADLDNDFSVIYPAVLAQAVRVLGFDPSTTLPANPAAPTSGGATAVQRQYAMLLGGAANAMNRIAISLGQLPSGAALEAFIEDFSDGDLDGFNGSTRVELAMQDIPTSIRINDEINRFRNNNFAAYSSTVPPSINEASFSQTAALINRVPVANNFSLSVVAGSSVQVDFFANAVDADADPLTLQAVGTPTQGTLTTSNGQTSFNAPAAATGTASFTYSVTDGQAVSNTATVTINIQPAPPVANVVGRSTAFLPFRVNNASSYDLKALPPGGGSPITLDSDIPYPESQEEEDFVSIFTGSYDGGARSISNAAVGIIAYVKAGRVKVVDLRAAAPVARTVSNITNACAVSESYDDVANPNNSLFLVLLQDGQGLCTDSTALVRFDMDGQTAPLNYDQGPILSNVLDYSNGTLVGYLKVDTANCDPQDPLATAALGLYTPNGSVALTANLGSFNCATAAAEYVLNSQDTGLATSSQVLYFVGSSRTINDSAPQYQLRRYVHDSSGGTVTHVANLPGKSDHNPPEAVYDASNLYFVHANQVFAASHSPTGSVGPVFTPAQGRLIQGLSHTATQLVVSTTDSSFGSPQVLVIPKAGGTPTPLALRFGTMTAHATGLPQGILLSTFNSNDDGLNIERYSAASLESTELLLNASFAGASYGTTVTGADLQHEFGSRVLYVAQQGIDGPILRRLNAQTGVTENFPGSTSSSVNIPGGEVEAAVAFGTGSNLLLTAEVLKMGATESDLDVFYLDADSPYMADDNLAVIANTVGLDELAIQFDGESGDRDEPLVARDDSFVVLQNSQDNLFNVLDNDDVPSGSTLSLVSLPALGTATVSGGVIFYTPNTDAFGDDGLLYRITDAQGNVSTAGVSIQIVMPAPPPAPVDSDGDGLDDGFELTTSNTNPNNPDTDADGVGDGVEQQAGSDPRVQNPVIRVSANQGVDTPICGSGWGNEACETNEGTDGVLNKLAGAAAQTVPVFVLYEEGSYDGIQIVRGSAPANLVLVGSVGPDIFLPNTLNGPTSAFSRICDSGCLSTVVVRDQPELGVIGLELVGVRDSNFNPVTVAQGGVLRLSSSSTTFSEVRIRDSEVRAGFAREGGGIYVEDVVLDLDRVLVQGNSAVNNVADAAGGGLLATGSANVFVLDSRFEENLVRFQGAGSAYGGGAASRSQTPGNFFDFSNTVFANNRAETDSGSAQGGGLYLIDVDSLNENLVMTGNSAGQGAAVYALVLNSPLSIGNSLIVGNRANELGGGAYLRSLSSSQLINFFGNTVAFNQTDASTDGSGGGLFLEGSMLLSRNIVYFNDNAVVASAYGAGDDEVAATGGVGVTGNNNFGEPTALGHAVTTPPTFLGGFYLDPATSEAVDYDGPGATNNGVPGTTQVDGASDLAPDDLGYHHAAAAQGPATSTRVISGTCVTFQTCTVDIQVSFGNNPKPEPGHLVRVRAVNPQTVSVIGVNTLPMPEGNTVMAQEVSPGVFRVDVVNNQAGTVGLEIFADDAPAPLTQTVIFEDCGCS